MAETLQDFLISVKYGVDTASEANFLGMLKRVAGSVAGVAGTIGGLYVSVLELSKVLAEAGDKFYFMSQRLGSSVTDIQNAAQAMSMLGETTEQAQGEIEKFGQWTRSMGPAATAWLRHLGVTATDTVGRMNQLAAYFQSHAARPGSQQYSLNMRVAQMMGISEQTMIGMQSGAYQKQEAHAGALALAVWGAKNPQELAQRQQDWAKQSNLVMNQFRDMGFIFEQMKEKFGLELFRYLLPELKKLNDWLLSNQDTFQHWFEVVAKVLGGFVMLVNTGIDVWEKLPHAMKAVFVSLMAIPGAIGLLKSPLFWFITALTTLILLMDDYNHWQKDPKTAKIDWSGFQKLVDIVKPFVAELNTVRTTIDCWIYGLTGVHDVFDGIAVALLLMLTRATALQGLGGLARILMGGAGAAAGAAGAGAAGAAGAGGLIGAIAVPAAALIAVALATEVIVHLTDMLYEWAKSKGFVRDFNPEGGTEPAPVRRPWYDPVEMAKKFIQQLEDLNKNVEKVLPGPRAPAAGTDGKIGLTDDSQRGIGRAVAVAVAEAVPGRGDQFAGPGAPATGYNGEAIAPAGGGWAARALTGGGAIDPSVPPRGQALLAAIGQGESGGDYSALTGGGHFSDFSHFPNWAGKGGSHAAGRYQFQPGTFERAARALNLHDFSPESQDKAAWWLAKADYYRLSGGRNLEADLQNPANAGYIGATLHPTWLATGGSGSAWANMLRQRLGNTSATLGGDTQTYRSGGAAGRGPVTVTNTTTVHVAAGPDAAATAAAVAAHQRRVHENHVRSAEGRLR